MYINIIYIILGIVLLMLGRKLFWLFAGAMAFVFGVESVPLILTGQSQYVIWIIALVLAIIVLVLAFLAQKIGLGIAGFVAGGYVAVSIINQLKYNIPWLPWLVFAVGGLIGVVLVIVLFDLAIVVLSSLCGAFLIVQAVGFNLYLTKILFVFLVGVGIITQTILTKKN